jgi:hypothetical protein
VSDLNTPLPSVGLDDPSTKKCTSELNCTIDQMNPINIYRIFHPTVIKYRFFSATHGTLSKINHILGHKASLNKYKMN